MHTYPLAGKQQPLMTHSPFSLSRSTADHPTMKMSKWRCSCVWHAANAAVYVFTRGVGTMAVYRERRPADSWTVLMATTWSAVDSAMLAPTASHLCEWSPPPPPPSLSLSLCVVLCVDCLHRASLSSLPLYRHKPCCVEAITHASLTHTHTHSHPPPPPPPLSLSCPHRFGGQVRHYRLYYDPQERCHLVGRQGIACTSICLVLTPLTHSFTHTLTHSFTHSLTHPPSYPLSAGEKPFDTIEDLVQDGLITLYMEANNVEEYLQTARRRTRRFTSSSSSYASLPSTSLPRPHPQASALTEPLLEEMEEVTPSPPPRSPALISPPPIVPREQSLSREERERSSSASSSAPSDHGGTFTRRRPRAYDEIEDITLPGDQRVSGVCVCE